MKFQVADVKKALGIATNIVRNGNRIVTDLDDDDGNGYAYIENKSTGEKLWLRESEGVYVLDMLVALLEPAPPVGPAAPPPESGFSGPGR